MSIILRPCAIPSKHFQILNITTFKCMETPSQLLHCKLEACPILTQIDTGTYAWSINLLLFVWQQVHVSDGIQVKFASWQDSRFCILHSQLFLLCFVRVCRLVWSQRSHQLYTFPCRDTRKRSQIHLPCLQVHLLHSAYAQTAEAGFPIHFSSLLLGHTLQNHPRYGLGWFLKFGTGISRCQSYLVGNNNCYGPTCSTRYAPILVCTLPRVVAHRCCRLLSTPCVPWGHSQAHVEPEDLAWLTQHRILI